jgi:hypothetical protein
VYEKIIRGHQRSGVRINMHYIFLDESYSSGNGQKTIIMAAWIVEQARYNRFFSTSQDLYRTPALEAITRMLETLDAWAIVARADLDEKVFRTGEIDGTDDIPSMSRSDNIWSLGRSRGEAPRFARLRHACV